MNKTQRILLLIISGILLVLLFGTVIAFISGKAQPGKDLRKEDPSPTTLVTEISDDEAVFSKIGILRCSTGDEPPIPLVINPYFPYPANDMAFYEELSKKTQKMRILIAEYVASYTREELLATGEETIKQELVDMINAQLVLGEIDVLYFSEYIFFE